MRDLYISTFYLKGKYATPEENLQFAKQEGFAGVEALFRFTPELAALMQSLELQLAVGYYGVENDEIRDADAYHLLGAKYVQSVGLPIFENYESTMRGIEQLNRQAEIAKREGFKVYVHNHPQDFKWNEVDGEYCWETVAKHMDPEGCVFQLDLGWCIIAGVDPYWLLNKYGHLVKSMHVKPATAILGVTAVDPLFKGGHPGQPATRELTPAEQLYKERAARGVVYDLMGAMGVIP